MLEEATLVSVVEPLPVVPEDETLAIVEMDPIVVDLHIEQVISLASESYQSLVLPSGPVTDGVHP